MTIVTAIIVALGVGYVVGMHRKAFVIFVGVFLAVLAFQSFIFPLTPWNRNIDPHDPGYWLTQPAILALGLGLTWIGAKVKEARSQRHSFSGDRLQ